jgi:hypothetical protein
VPLAAVAVSTQVGETCPSGGICGTVFSDTNGNGVQDEGEPGIVGAVVTVTYVVDGTAYDFTVMTTAETPTSPAGLYDFGTAVPPGEWNISVQIPNGTSPSPVNVGETGSGDVPNDSDGVSDNNGNSVAKVNWDGTNQTSSTDFGFTTSGFANPGTGTPGYWKNHPEAWPVSTITIGNVTYTKEQAIAKMETPVQKDKTYTIFSSLVAAILNTHPLVGNDNTCVQAAIDGAQQWFKTYGPVGSNVAASSYAWKVGEPLHRQMDNYNNGMLCVQHRD